MYKIWRVTITEYLNAIRTKAFMIGVLALPLFVCVSAGLQYYGRKNVDIRDRRFAVVDRTGALFPVIAAKAVERNGKFIAPHGTDGMAGQTSPKFLPELFAPIMQSPGSSFARWFSLFPPATPMLMLLRIAIPPGPPWWEIALSVVLTTLFMLASVWAAAKIFRIGILAQGQAPSFAKLLAWILSK